MASRPGWSAGAPTHVRRALRPGPRNSSLHRDVQFWKGGLCWRRMQLQGERGKVMGVGRWMLRCSLWQRCPRPRTAVSWGTGVAWRRPESSTGRPHPRKKMRRLGQSVMVLYASIEGIITVTVLIIGTLRGDQLRGDQGGQVHIPHLD